MFAKLSNAALRSTTGAFILNSGINKLGLRGESAAGLQRMAAQGIPAVGQLSPDQFGKFMSYGEIAVGAALLLPLVPTRIAGAGLGALSAGLVAAYFRTSSMTESDGIRPSSEGIGNAKDLWLAAIALSLMLRGSAD